MTSRRTIGLGLVLLALPSLALAQGRSSRRGQDKAETEEAALCENSEEVFAPFVTEVAAGNVGPAMDTLAVVLNNGELAGCHGQAWIRLGGLLEKEGFGYAGALAWSEGMKLDPEASSKQVVTRFLELGTEVGDQALLEETFAGNVGFDADKETRSHIAYLGARGAYVQGNYSTALGILALVDMKGPDAEKALALKGVVLAQQNRYNDALVALLTAQAQIKDPELLDTVNLNIGRTYYASGNYPRAIEYYAKVRRESHFWPEAQFERGWAHFRIQDVNGALGILHTHTTEFYGEWYFPEAELLRTYSLFLICKFPEASSEIDKFQARWTPFRDDLEPQIAGMSAQDVWADGRSFVESGESELPAMVIRDLPFDKTFTEAMSSVDAADKELSLLEGRSGEWVSFAQGMLKERRDSLIQSNGQRVKDSVEADVRELSSMLTDTEIAKLDMLRLETKLYEQAAEIGQIPDAQRKAERKERVRRGYQSWPYEGEIWADELGYYRVNAKMECPPGLMQSGK
ncbi:MAG: tetratricopeptide repeat protein [Myxococcota bacterium]|nr:tetratricopeptide repeat protein [Myxococcota bacterium]